VGESALTERFPCRVGLVVTRVLDLLPSKYPGRNPKLRYTLLESDVLRAVRQRDQYVNISRYVSTPGSQLL
jgi:hypothetical protein